MSEKEPSLPPDDLPHGSSDSTIAPSDASAQQGDVSASPSDGAAVPASSGGPINLEKIRQLRLQQQSSSGPSKQRAGKPAAAGPARAADKTQAGNTTRAGETVENAEETAAGAGHGKKKGKVVETGVLSTPPRVMPRVAVPSRRAPLSEDLESELAQALGGDIDLDRVLVGDQSLQVGHLLDEGQRIQATVLKMHEENVFVTLGGPNEGVLSILQFEKPPAVGDQFEVVVRGFLADEGLYELTVPGAAVDVADWSEIKEGETVEATITGSNAGGLECTLGNIRGFIPASQVAPYRVENLAEFVGQKMLCVITEANQRRGNLVLSRRSVLERERVEQREQRLAALEVGAAITGTVRKITDFGAFVDLGGLDGLLHISQLSWDRIKHPSELLEEGQQIQVRVDKVDPQSGKISLSYRSLQEHPWTNIEARFPVGSVVKGTVTRLAEFGAFVKLATGIEGLVHLSEIAHYRVQRVNSVLKQSQEVDVKILTIDEEKQRIGLSIKAAQSPAAGAEAEPEVMEEEQESAPAKASRKSDEPLKGGIGSHSGGERFGLKW
jgi:predicted RNA-binding protein with RPS1 domain